MPKAKITIRDELTAYVHSQSDAVQLPSCAAAWTAPSFPANLLTRIWNFHRLRMVGNLIPRIRKNMWRGQLQGLGMNADVPTGLAEPVHRR